MSTTNSTPRSRHYHGGFKGKVTKNTVQPAPAWRTRNLPPQSGSASGDTGGKILLSNLPIDVSEEEVVDLMRKTIGPVILRDSLMVHNAKGVPFGMAIISFTRGNDAWKARSRYNGKVIDGKRAIKLEVIIDKDAEPPSPPPNTKERERPKSLFDRLGPLSQPQSPKPNAHVPVSNGQAASRRQPTLIERTAPKLPHTRTHATSTASSSSLSSLQARVLPPVATNKKRKKKGPKRVKKTVVDLDREMEEYTAARSDEVNITNGNGFGNGFDGYNGVNGDGIGGGV